MKGTFPIHKFRELRTPFYYYDTKVLRDTLSCIRTEAARYGNYSVHYAVKANANPKVLAIIRENGLGADCVSGGEIRAAIKAGFPTGKIVFAGVGKADWEINLGLDYDIFCFNVESVGAAYFDTWQWFNLSNTEVTFPATYTYCSNNLSYFLRQLIKASYDAYSY